eukprot:jgi/Astpho2/6389/Aster-x0727
MPAERSSRRDKAGNGGYDDDGASSVSTSTHASGNGNAEDDTYEEADPWDEAVDGLREKRATTRERACLTVVGLLSSMHDAVGLIARQQTLGNQFLNSIRRGGAAEATLAARALGLLIVTLGASDEAERLQQEAQPVLERAAKHGTARMAAIEMLGITAFVAADHSTCRELMEDLQALWGVTGFKGQVAAAAIRAWTLLLSSLPAWHLTASSVEVSMAALASALHSSEIEVRVAAGEGIAMLYQTSGLADLPADAAEDGDLDDSSSTAGSEQAEALQSGLDDAVDRMRALATNRGDPKRRSKQDRARLKGSFRELCSAVESQSTPTTKVKLRHGDVLIVDTLPATIQLNAFRNLLADGFQAHLQHNALLHQIFKFQPREEPPERLTPEEKRLYRSPASAQSKSRTQQRKSDRAASAAYKGAMMA